MAVLKRTELEQSPLADLHALAAELGVEGFRRLRKATLIDTLLGEPTEPDRTSDPAPAGAVQSTVAGRGERAGRQRAPRQSSGGGRASSGGSRTSGEAREQAVHESGTGTLELRPNGSGFLRSNPDEAADDDIYVSPAQIRRCRLRSGDQVAGPARAPRRSERYRSLVRVDTVNGEDPEARAKRPDLDALTATWATAKLSLPDDLDVPAFGRGSRVVVTGAPGSGTTTLLRAIATGLAAVDDLDLTVILAGVRPEEVGEWREALAEGSLVGGGFDGSPEEQSDVARAAIDLARSAAEDGRDAALVVDSLEGLAPAVRRRLLAAARNTAEAGSVTVVAGAGDGPEPARHATTRIVLGEPAADGRPAIDADRSVTLRADLLS